VHYLGEVLPTVFNEGDEAGDRSTLALLGACD
jgi:hypothetical protein